MAGKTVSTRYMPLRLTVPAGTTQGAPMSTPLPLGEVIWEQTQIIIPSGHSGLTGIRFLYAGEPIVPWGRPPSWITANDTELTFEVGIEVGNPVMVEAYNIDYFDHTFLTYTKVSDQPMPTVGVPGMVIVPITQSGGAL